MRLFRQAEQIAPSEPSIQHNLALVSFAGGDSATARSAAERAVTLSPALWQSHALLARIHRAGNHVVATEAAWQRVLEHSPGNGTALLGLADLAINEFGDPAAAIELVKPLTDDAVHGVDAELTRLMASLYAGAEPMRLTADLIAFSRRNLRLPRSPARVAREGRRRIGVISPLFSASPVFQLGWSTLAALAKVHDLIFLNRGTRRDAATARLREIAHAWIELAHVEPAPLAHRLAELDLDVILDLGGWSDVAALAALSAKPAARMYKWVGGQSATTGLDMFDGWIGDTWQSPPSAQSLYAEPLVAIDGGYVDYTPPPALAKHRGLRKSGVGLVGNPTKIAAATLAAWPSGVTRVTLIDRRYAHSRTLARVTDLLGRGGIQVDRVVVPAGQDEYLAAVGACEAIVNTQPYAAGLTVVEALAMDVKLLAGPQVGPLFCSRHHLSHLQTRGSNSRLAAQICSLMSR